jgi:hypothetical protein
MPRPGPLLVLAAAVAAVPLAWGLAGPGKAPSPQDGGVPAARAVFHKDFRTADLDPEALHAAGPGVERDAKGLRLVLDADPDSHHTGFDTAFPVRGDFEITVAYEVLGGDRPTTGYGVGVGLYAPIDPAAQDAVSLARRLMPDGTVQFASDRMTPVNGQVKHRVRTMPATAPVGKLRLERAGPVLRYLVADGADAPFVAIEELELGAADLCYVRVEGNAGGSQAALDARVLDFSVRAASLPGLPDPGTSPAPRPTRGAGWRPRPSSACWSSWLPWPGGCRRAGAEGAVCRARTTG